MSPALCVQSYAPSQRGRSRPCELVPERRVGRILSEALIGKVVRLSSELGELQVGRVDPTHEAIAAAISRLLMRCSNDFRESRGGHVPDPLVDGLQRVYTTVNAVRSTYALSGHRFVVLHGETLLATVLVAREEDTILIMDRDHINVSARRHPGFKPEGYHQIFNLAVQHEIRRLGLGSRLFETISQEFRSHFGGRGLWMRADPPWHDKLVGLGFQHDPSMDSFLPDGVPRTWGLDYPSYNARFRCQCACPCDAAAAREANFGRYKLKYFSFHRDFA